jgi:hypothetical protein
MTTATIITQFELQVDDVTELSATEELVLLNRVYKKILQSRPWHFLRIRSIGTLSEDTNGYYVDLPSNFFYLLESYNYNEKYMNNDDGSSGRYILIGDVYYPFVNYQNIGNYTSGYAYIDVADSKIRIIGTPEDTDYEFFYIKMPSDLVSGGSPIFHENFHPMIVYGMATENDVMQLSDKAKSYASENQRLYNHYMSDMEYWDSQFSLI